MQPTTLTDNKSDKSDTKLSIESVTPSDCTYDESPNTMLIIKSILSEKYWRWKIVQGMITIFTASTILAPKPFTTGVFGFSGSGKTVAQQMALEIAKNNGIDLFSIEKGGFTLSGFAKLFSEDIKGELKESREELLNCTCIYLEDLADVTDYVSANTISLLTSFSESKSFEYVTGNNQVKVTLENLKRNIFGGTDMDYFTLMDNPVWDKKVKRRMIPVMLYYFPQELLERSEEVDCMSDYQQKGTKGMSAELFQKRGWDKIKVAETDAYYQNDAELRGDASRDVRNAARRVLENTKPGFVDPNSMQYLAVSLAGGHAIFNGRDYICNDDYYFIIDFMERFCLPFNAWDFRAFMYLLSRCVTQPVDMVSLDELALPLKHSPRKLREDLFGSKVLSMCFDKEGILEKNELEDSVEFQMFGNPKYCVRIDPGVIIVKKKFDAKIQQLGENYFNKSF